MKRFAGILLIILLILMILCSCTGTGGKKTAQNQNELSEFLKDKMIVYYLDDGSVVCYASVHSGGVPGTTENTYYRYFPEENSFVTIEEGPKLFAVSGDMICVGDKVYEACRYYTGDGSDLKSGYREFDLENNTFRIVGEDEEIYKSLSASEIHETLYDVNYTDCENYCYIVDEYKPDVTYRSYYRHYDKDGNLLRNIELPVKFNDVREEYGSFSKMKVMGEYVYLEISGMSYSAVLKITDDDLKIVSEGLNGRLALGYDPSGGAEPVLYKKDNNLSIFDVSTGKLNEFKMDISDVKGENINTVWQNGDSVLICIAEDMDRSGWGKAYFIIPTEELRDTILGDENTLYFHRELG